MTVLVTTDVTVKIEGRGTGIGIVFTVERPLEVGADADVGSDGNVGSAAGVRRSGGTVTATTWTVVVSISMGGRLS